jgi:DNA-binding CsgD family transcriptional regulator
VTRRARTFEDGLRVLLAYGGWAGIVIESGLLAIAERSSRVDLLCTHLNLTSREVQLLAYALGREPRRLVLKRLGITVNTLKSQVRTLLRKCGGRSLAELTYRIAHDSNLFNANGSRHCWGPPA